MLSHALLAALLALSASSHVVQKPKPVVWRFPDENAATLRAAVSAKPPSGHLVTGAAIDGFLKTTTPTNPLGCIIDEVACEEPDRAMLTALGLAARIDATAERADGGMIVTLTLTPADPALRIQTHAARGSDVGEALRKAMSSLEGQAIVRAVVEPPTATIMVDDAPLGVGPGDYGVGPGAHRVRATQDGYDGNEVAINVSPGDVATVTFKLLPRATRLRLVYAPTHARVRLDGERFADSPGVYEVRPGPHALRISADGYRTDDQTVDCLAGRETEVRADLEGLAADFADRLGDVHPDVRRHAWIARLAGRMTWVSDGEVGAGPDTFFVKAVDDSETLGGFDAGLTWRSRFLEVEALGLSYSTGGDPQKSSLRSGAQGEFDKLSRLQLRGAWVGLHYPRWRFDPYLRGGAAAVRESFVSKIRLGTAARGSDESINHWLLTFGGELGVRHQINDEWVINVAGQFDAGPSTRPSAAFLVGAGRSFSLFEDETPPKPELKP